MKIKLVKLIDIPENGWTEHSLQTAFGSVSVMLKRSNSSFSAFVNECPHQGRRMDYAKDSFLETPEGLLICPAHGATFDTQTGLCKEGPCVGQSLNKLAVEIKDNSLYVEY